MAVTLSGLLETLHGDFLEGQPTQLDATSLVTFDATPDATLIESVCTHTCLRSENQTVAIITESIDCATPWLNYISAFPNLPPHVTTAISVLLPFLTCSTERNARALRHCGLALTIGLTQSGKVAKTRLKIDLPLAAPHLSPPTNDGCRNYDVFYHIAHLLRHLPDSLASESLRNTCQLKPSLRDYALIGTAGDCLLGSVPSSLLDDAALAEDWQTAWRSVGLEDIFPDLCIAITAILLLGNGIVDEKNADVAVGAANLQLPPEILDEFGISELLRGVYSGVIGGVVEKLNEFLSKYDDIEEICGEITIVDLPIERRSEILQTVFNDTIGLNAEMISDGVPIVPTTAFLSTEIESATARARQIEETDWALFERLGRSNFCKNLYPKFLWLPNNGDKTGELHLCISNLFISTRVWTVLRLNGSESEFWLENRQFSKKWHTNWVSRQIRQFYLAEWVTKRQSGDFSVDFGIEEFVEHFKPILPPNIEPTSDSVARWAVNTKKYQLDEFFCGSERVWLDEDVWTDLETQLEFAVAARGPIVAEESELGSPEDSVSFFSEVEVGDEENFDTDKLVTNAETGRAVEVRKITRSRRFWLTIVWIATFFIPSFLLRHIGNIKRAEARTAWREKTAICMLIFLANAAMLFYMAALGNILCPDRDSVYTESQLSAHADSDSFYVAVRGSVYDLTDYWRGTHPFMFADTKAADMFVFAGTDVTNYFPRDVAEACPDLVKLNSDDQQDSQLWLSPNNTAYYTTAIHWYGEAADASVAKDEAAGGPDASNPNWYKEIWEPQVAQLKIGGLVVSPKQFKADGLAGYAYWAVIDGTVYDITDYTHTLTRLGVQPGRDLSSDVSESVAQYSFLPTKLVALFMEYSGQDITKKISDLDIPETTKATAVACIKEMFTKGKIDFRDSARCQAANYVLLSIAIVLSAVTLIKFLAALQFGGERKPEPQTRFVICQIPAYTEDESSLRLAIDSVASTNYPDERKLLFVICDGKVTGSGNEKPTCEIVLDIFNVPQNERISAPELPFRSVAEGSAQLNFGQIFSGLYLCNGHVVPFVVVSKIGSPNETGTRPGNRGKRDSQLFLFRFLNHVHFQRPMSPLELELFHHVNNIIGIDPELYEYLLMVDADTKVAEDSLAILIAECVADGRIAGICGYTGLLNEQRSLWTMIQVYEYYISHFLTKAFESLFGSVTCLPGCFSLYRLRTPDRARPLLISDAVINDYGINIVDTLHLKNLFSLGEDRYLTTVMMKHFGGFKYVFTGYAEAFTAAPEDLKVLLSQRRRWINSTVHNLVELLKLGNMCGFCIVGMRFIVFVDLAGTILLPSVFLYLVYLVYRIAAHDGQFPLISVIMIAAVYGLQAILFILKKQWQHIGWMIIYFLAYPVHSFLLPIYSFWNQDNFSWGNTRVVLEEKNGKQIISVSEEKFDPRKIPLECWADFAARNNLPGAERPEWFEKKKLGPNAENPRWRVNSEGGFTEFSDFGDDDPFAEVYEVPDFHPGSEMIGMRNVSHSSFVSDFTVSGNANAGAARLGSPRGVHNGISVDNRTSRLGNRRIASESPFCDPSEIVAPTGVRSFSSGTGVTRGSRK